MSNKTNDSFGFGDLDLDAIIAEAPAQAFAVAGDSATSSSSLVAAPKAAIDSADYLLDDIKSSIEQMQAQMQDTYQKLNVTRLTGESTDGKVKLTMTATYIFEDIEMDDDAFAEGPRELKWRIREAFRDLMKKIQERTQEQTMSLLQGMDIPDEIKNLGEKD
jgi:DNA-binding protein YbaB